MKYNPKRNERIGFLTRFGQRCIRFARTRRQSEGLLELLYDLQDMFRRRSADCRACSLQPPPGAHVGTHRVVRRRRVLPPLDSDRNIRL